MIVPVLADEAFDRINIDSWFFLKKTTLSKLD